MDIIDHLYANNCHFSRNPLHQCTETRPSLSTASVDLSNEQYAIIGDVSDRRSIIGQPIVGDYFSIVQIAVCHFIFILLSCVSLRSAKQNNSIDM